MHIGDIGMADKDNGRMYWASNHVTKM